MRQSLLIVLVLWTSVAYAEDGQSNAAKQYQELVEGFEEEGGTRTFAKRFLTLAQEYPEDAAAADALCWVVRKVKGRPDTDTALDLLREKHGTSLTLKPLLASVVTSRSARAEPLLREIMQRHPDESTRGHACFYLARLLDSEAALVEQIEAHPELETRVRQYYGKLYGQHLLTLDPDELEEERETLYEELERSFPTVVIGDQTGEQLAKKALFRMRHLTVGKVAPEIEGEDVDGQQLKLSDFRGNVVMLTFWGHW